MGCVEGKPDGVLGSEGSIDFQDAQTVKAKGTRRKGSGDEEYNEKKESFPDSSSDKIFSFMESSPKVVFTKDQSFSQRDRKISHRMTRCESNYDEVRRLVQNAKLSSSSSRGACLGIIGLQNLGNTCFMNSAIQCLSNVIPLTDYFLGYDWRSEINRKNPLGMKGEIATAFGQLISKMWTESSTVIAPRDLKAKISKFNSHFSGYQQHDAQELLAFLLDGLHEDLNRVRRKPYVEAVESGGRADEEVAREAWAGYLRRDRSVIVDVFQGQLRNRLRCKRCGHASTKFDPFMYLSLPVPAAVGALAALRGRRRRRAGGEAAAAAADEGGGGGGGGGGGLAACIDGFCETEQLDGDNKWYCPKCKAFQPATKKLDIWKFPNVLIIHLKRFHHNRMGSRKKLNTFVDYPLEGLDLDSFAKSPQREPATYDLCGVINHHGTLSGGHYTAAGRNRADGRWRAFDDARCSAAAAGDVCSSAAYVLFYQKVVEGEGDGGGGGWGFLAEDMPAPGLDTRQGSVGSVASSVNSQGGSRRAAQIRRQTIAKPHLWPHTPTGSFGRTGHGGGGDAEGASVSGRGEGGKEGEGPPPLRRREETGGSDRGRRRRRKGGGKPGAGGGGGKGGGPPPSSGKHRRGGARVRDNSGFDGVQKGGAEEGLGREADGDSSGPGPVQSFLARLAGGAGAWGAARPAPPPGLKGGAGPVAVAPASRPAAAAAARGGRGGAEGSVAAAAAAPPREEEGGGGSSMAGVSWLPFRG